MTTFLNPYNPFLNPRTGDVITHGRIYIGLPFTDPTQERNQVPVTSTTSNIDAMEQRAIVQPIRILNGLLVDRTLPISINLAGSHFSIAVFDNNGIEIYYASSIQYDSSADNNDSAETIVRDFQNFGVPSFIDATGNPFAAGFAFSYGKGSRVRFNDLNYVSLVDDNRAVPGDARFWRQEGTEGAISEFSSRVLGIGRIYWLPVLNLDNIPDQFIALNGQTIVNARDTCPLVYYSTSRFIRRNGNNVQIFAVNNAFFRGVDRNNTDLGEFKTDTTQTHTHMSPHSDDGQNVMVAGDTTLARLSDSDTNDAFRLPIYITQDNRTEASGRFEMNDDGDLANLQPTASTPSHFPMRTIMFLGVDRDELEIQ